MDETDSPQNPTNFSLFWLPWPMRAFLPRPSHQVHRAFQQGGGLCRDLDQFEKEFNEDLAVIAHAIKAYGLPENIN